ncbi:accessory factor UbiK family protein [Paracoccaceae bacterium]|nr:accessory factor UbiK family protein [Paracoccaceae bacterium]
MQFKNPLIDNLSKVMADAFGAAHSAKNEAESVLKTWLDGWLAERDFVTREEFEALKIAVEELKNKTKEKPTRKNNKT